MWASALFKKVGTVNRQNDIHQPHLFVGGNGAEKRLSDRS